MFQYQAVDLGVRHSISRFFFYSSPPPHPLGTLDLSEHKKLCFTLEIGRHMQGVDCLEVKLNEFFFIKIKSAAGWGTESPLLNRGLNLSEVD